VIHNASAAHARTLLVACGRSEWRGTPGQSPQRERAPVSRAPIGAAGKASPIGELNQKRAERAETGENGIVQRAVKSPWTQLLRSDADLVTRGPNRRASVVSAADSRARRALHTSDKPSELNARNCVTATEKAPNHTSRKADDEGSRSCGREGDTYSVALSGSTCNLQTPTTPRQPCDRCRAASRSAAPPQGQTGSRTIKPLLSVAHSSPKASGPRVRAKLGREDGKQRSGCRAIVRGVAQTAENIATLIPC